MRPLPDRWVPPGAWLTDTYAEWPPPAALRGQLACLWASTAPGNGGQPHLTRESRALSGHTPAELYRLRRPPAA